METELKEVDPVYFLKSFNFLASLINGNTIILNTLRETFPQGKPSLEQLYQVLKTITNSIACQGIFNYLLSDGEHFFAHCSTKLSYIIRQYPFAAAHLIDEDVSVDFQALARPGDQVAIIATTPLTDNEDDE